MFIFCIFPTDYLIIKHAASLIYSKYQENVICIKFFLSKNARDIMNSHYKSLRFRLSANTFLALIFIILLPFLCLKMFPDCD